MAKRIAERNLKAILKALEQWPQGASLSDIEGTLDGDIAQRTLQYRLKYLVDEKRLTKQGERRWAKYRLPTQGEARAVAVAEAKAEEKTETRIPLSEASGEIRHYLKKPVGERKPVGYDREFLESYRPNVTFYLSAADRETLAKMGKPNFDAQAAGTYAKQILNRLLIDLSWNSSRLEGNTYSLLDTKRLIESGQEAEGRDRREAQMIINHKEAIAFLVGAADEIGFNRYTILNLHGILAHNLLADETAEGRLRRIAVGIEKSAFHPLELPQLIEECFNQVLATAAAIKDPFEQAFFVMVQLPYLQPFDDVNKRVSRLSANIPFIKVNLSPLSFTDVPRDIYTEAVLGIYELKKTDLLHDVFMWAYERSAARYAAVRQSLGEPDPFKFKHGAALRQVIGEVIKAGLDKKAAAEFITGWVAENVEQGDREQFRDSAEAELLSLHEGNFARYQVRPSEFAAWQKAWEDAGR